MTLIKMCGMTRAEDVAHAVGLGVDALGFVLWPRSPRHVSMADMAVLVRLLPDTVRPVGVFVDPDEIEVRRAADAGIRVAQLHGARSAALLPIVAPHVDEVWVAASLEAHHHVPATSRLVLDAHDPVQHGGTGRIIDWARAATIAAARPVLLAGGLTAANVGDAIARVRPAGVDVASGIERRPGIKNHLEMTAFVHAVRETD